MVIQTSVANPIVLIPDYYHNVGTPPSTLTPKADYTLAWFNKHSEKEEEE